MTDDELRVPGVAWEEAKKALAAGNVAEAERLCAFMAKSDAKLMRQRIDATPNSKGVSVNSSTHGK